MKGFWCHLLSSAYYSTPSVSLQDTKWASCIVLSYTGFFLTRFHCHHQVSELKQTVQTNPWPSGLNAQESAHCVVLSLCEGCGYLREARILD